MAVEWALEDDDEENQNKDTSSGGAQEIGGAPAMVSGAQQPSDSPGTSSGSYTNLQKYIEANKGRDFGGQVAGKIEGGVDEGLNQLDQREGEFKSAVDENTLALNDDLKQHISDAPQSLDQNEKTQAGRLLKDSYKGPTDFMGGVDDSDPYAQLRKYFGGLDEQSKAVGNAGGQKALLEQFYNRPSYTEGEKSLDTYLLGQQKGAIEGAKGKLSGAVSQYGQKSKELSDYAKNASKTSDAAKASYRQLLGLDDAGTALPFERGSGQSGLIQKQLDDLYGRAETRKSSATSEKSALSKTGGDLRNPAAASVYKNLGGEERLYGIDPTQFLSSPELNYQTVASPSDLARMKALTELAGLPQNYLNESLVGTADDEALNNFDLSGFQRAIQGKKDALRGELLNTYYSPFDSNPWNKNGAGAAYSGTIADENSVPEIALRNQLATASSDADRANRQRQLDEIAAKREEIRNKYGYNQLISR